MATFSAAPLLEGVTMAGYTALHAVASHGDNEEFFRCADIIYERAKHLLFAKNNKGDTPLHCAVRAGKSRMVSHLIALATSEDDNTKHKLLREVNGLQETALHEAVRIGDEKMVEKLMELDPELAYYPKDQGVSPLYLAIWLHKDRIAQTLHRQSNGNLSYSGSNGQNALHIAVLRNTEMTKQVLEWNKSLTIQRDGDGSTPLHFASSLYDWILNMQDNDGNTALHLAVQAGNFRIFCTLLGNRKVQLTLPNNCGETPYDLSRSKLPRGIVYVLNSENQIWKALGFVGANCSALRGDKSNEKYSRRVKPEDIDRESEKVKDATQVYSVVSVLIATVTFGANFALPGGYRVDDHTNGGTPTLAGTFTFDAFIMANTLAFICSTIATFGFMSSGISMVNLATRQFKFITSGFFMASSITSMSAAFALGVYMVLAPVAHKTALAVSIIIPFGGLLTFEELLFKRILLARPLCVRNGLYPGMVWILLQIFDVAWRDFWPFVVIFGWAAFARIHR